MLDSLCVSVNSDHSELVLDHLTWASLSSLQETVPYRPQVSSTVDTVTATSPYFHCSLSCLVMAKTFRPHPPNASVVAVHPRGRAMASPAGAIELPDLPLAARGFRNLPGFGWAIAHKQALCRRMRFSR
ncbi:hypothetical protein MIND_00861200 [Mycena indigotica]|uniref:Uncharacterized protein n=1 Tax=Mycena indigotica TaxID=2126181 RepID=A0A8H6SGH7_9AGAR|nr:uncharacterized protein MIND_00861200 [Mycena indigotica]KAF7299128.1 hypothetical protein MIND_00861200 [Mycena indigotica]